MIGISTIKSLTVIFGRFILGVDTSATVALKFAGGKTACLTTNAHVQLPNETQIVGTIGTIRLPHPMWCTDKVELHGKMKHFPFPDTVVPCNFLNSSGLRYEAVEVRKCLQNGLLESPILPLADSLMIRQITDEIFNQIGVQFIE